MDWTEILYTASTWAIPAILAITLHEAAHGFVARRFGDDTAWRLGRVSANPFKHIDPFGTILLPGMLLLMHSPFLFGYAKPVPVRFANLRNPRRDMIWVAAAGPASNLAMATIAALLAHVVGLVPPQGQDWLLSNIENAIVLNVMLAVFNMIPIPPLDGGRVLSGVLPPQQAYKLSRIEPYGIAILFGLIILASMVPRFGALFWLPFGYMEILVRSVLGL